MGRDVRAMLGLMLALVGCGEQEAALREQTAALEVRGATLQAQLQSRNPQQIASGEGLLIELAFGAEADLDLYVTDPLLETVYFANKKGKSGGAISADRRCDSAALRVEEVRFDAPLSGAYRIGIDYPTRCDNADTATFKDRAAYTLSIEHDGHRKTITGTVGYRFFEVAALEFTIDNPNNKESGHEK